MKQAKRTGTSKWEGNQIRVWRERGREREEEREKETDRRSYCCWQSVGCCPAHPVGKEVNEHPRGGPGNQVPEGTSETQKCLGDVISQSSLTNAGDREKERRSQTQLRVPRRWERGQVRVAKYLDRPQQRLYPWGHVWEQTLVETTEG